jgi:hypothetical protein
MAEARLPSRRWYVLAAFLLVASAAVAFVGMFMSLKDVAFTHAEFPGTVQCTVKIPGEWVVCIESIDGSVPREVPMEIGVLDDSGRMHQLQPLDREFSYQFGSIRGRGVGRINVDAGERIFEGRVPPGVDGAGQTWRYAVGANPIQRMGVTMMVGGGIAVVLFTLGMGSWILVFWMRWKNRGTL